MYVEPALARTRCAVVRQLLGYTTSSEPAVSILEPAHID
jgi:hypothetical protein|eukprot:COSAG01_NODE_6644_length_3566_cov_4.395443_6_plen_39_part_00